MKKAFFVIALSLSIVMPCESATIRERVRERILERVAERQIANEAGISANSTRVITHEGLKRSYLFHVPPLGDLKMPVPLVIVLHGGGHHAEGAVRMSQMDAVADRERFLIAYPNG